jgi:hypothetical protein
MERADPCDFFLWPQFGSVNVVQFEIGQLSIAFQGHVVVQLVEALHDKPEVAGLIPD